MTTTEKKSISEQVIEVLYSKGEMTAKQLAEFIPYQVKSIHGKCIELMKAALLERKGGGGPQGRDFIWKLRPGVTPQTLSTGELEEVKPSSSSSETPPESTSDQAETDQKAPILSSKGIPLTQKSMFINHLVGIGVSPKDAIPSIADLFFSGDIEDLKWLNEVLQKGAAGFVTPQQRRFTLSWWGKTRGLPYREEDYYFEDQETSKGQKEEKGPKRPLDTGQGWRVGKDKHGDWVALPGGDMNYDEALAAAERRALIASYGTPPTEEEAGEVDEGEEGKPRRPGGKRSESMVDYMMKKLVDNLVDGQKGKGDGESGEVKRLTERIENMERERQEERFERLEGLIAQVVNRDPWDDYDRIQQMKDRLGGGGPTVTDQSPAVQLIKDSTDKVDKNVNRLVGIVERVVLRSDEFKPEETRTHEEREDKAGQLLDTARSGDRHKRLRRDTFGI